MCPLTQCPFLLEVTRSSEGWALWQKQPKQTVPIGFWSQSWEGTEAQHTAPEEQL